MRKGEGLWRSKGMEMKEQVVRRRKRRKETGKTGKQRQTRECRRGRIEERGWNEKLKGKGRGASYERLVV